MPNRLKVSYKGVQFAIVHCEGALDSYLQAVERLTKNKRISQTNALISQISRLANGERLSKEHFPQEGNLPKRPGQPTKKFWALKKKPLRGYCWLSDAHPKTYFISHYVYKDWDKLSESDTNTVGLNWQRIEEAGHER